MSAVTAPEFVASSAAATAPMAGRLVKGALLVVALLALVLLALSLVPSATLAAPLIGAAGEARDGSYSQDLATYLDQRLRFAAGVLLALVAGLALTLKGVEELIDDTRTWSVAYPSKATLALVGAPTLLGLALRIPFLMQPMRYDEALTFNEFAARPLYYGLSFYPDPNNHLLNTLLMHGAFAALGNQPWVLRLPALLGGVLLVPATFWLAGTLGFDRRAACFAALLVATSSYLIEYSANARGYTLQALCFVVMLGLVTLAAATGSRSSLLLAALVAAVGAYAVPTMLYGVIVAAAWFFIARRRARATAIGVTHAVASGLILALATTLAYLPVLVVSGSDKVIANRFVVPLALNDLASQLPTSLAQTWALWNRDIPLPVAALLLIGFVIGSSRAPVGLLAAALCLVLVLMQRVAPFERVWLFLLPLYLAIAAGGLARSVDGRFLAVAFGVVLSFVTLSSGSILSSTETGVFPDAESVTQALAPRLAPDDAVMTTIPASLPELQYYFPRAGLSIDTLVRSPDEAQNLYVIAPPAAPPAISGWRVASEIARFGAADVYELSRAAPTTR